MTIPTDVQAALTRLSGGYNNGDYNASTNPLGFSNGGHRVNLYALTADFVLVGVWYEGLSEPINGITTEITALGAIVDDITALAAIDDDVSTLAAIHAAVSTVAGIAANITTVAGIAANVTTVAGVASAVSNLSSISADVTAVAGVKTDVTQVSTIHADVSQVSTVHTAVSTVSGISGNVTTVSGIAGNVTTVAGISADVTAVAGKASEVGTLAPIVAAIGTLADIEDGTTATAAISDLAAIADDVTTAAANDANITTVATNIANVNTVAGNSANVTKVATIDANVTTVAGIDSDVTQVASIHAAVTTTAGVASAVSAVAADTTNIDAVAGDLTNINTVAGVAGNVTTVAGVAPDVTTVAGKVTDVSAVAAKITDVTTVAGITDDVSGVAAIDAAVSTVAGIDTAVTGVAAISANVSTVATAASAVTTVAGISSDVTTVAGIGGTDIGIVADAAADIGTAAANITAIQGAAGNASDAASSATAAAGYASTTKSLTTRFAFNDSTSDADPGSGKVAFNDDTVTDVTVLYFSTTENGGGSVAGWLSRFDSSTNLADRGEVSLVKDGAPGVFAKFKVVDATTSATGYRKIAVAYVASAGTWANGDTFGVLFSRTGDAGNDGEGAGNVNYVSTTPTEGQLIAAGGAENTIKDSGVAVSTDGTLSGNADTTLPTQKAVKTYADTKIASSYLDTDGTLAANSDTKIATQKAVKTYALPASYLDTDGTLAGNSDSKVASQKAVKTYADALIAANDAMVFKGVIDCSTNPSYPAADSGHTYRVSVAGKIGGSSGAVVEAGDLAICISDSTASGNQATVGSSWTIVQVNIDGAVVGPASVTNQRIAVFSGTTGKLIADGGKAIADLATTDASSLTSGTLPSGRLGFAAASDVQAGTNTTKPIHASAAAGSNAFQALTDGATINWDMSAGFNAKVTLGGARTLATPTNPIEGMTYALQVIQDGTGSRTLTLPASTIFDFGGAGAPTLSTGTGKIDMLYLICLNTSTPLFKASFIKGS